MRVKQVLHVLSLAFTLLTMHHEHVIKHGHSYAIEHGEESEEQDGHKTNKDRKRDRKRIKP